MQTRTRPQGSGFSLLELILTLTVLAALATALVVFYFRRPDVTLDNAARLLVEDLRTAQGLALNAGAPTRFEFEGDLYRALDSRGRALIHPRTGVDFVRDYRRDAIFEGVRVLDVELGGEDAFSFQPDGLPTRGGSVLLGFGEEQKRVRIDPDQGWISLD